MQLLKCMSDLNKNQNFSFKLHCVDLRVKSLKVLIKFDNVHAHYTNLNRDVPKTCNCKG